MGYGKNNRSRGPAKAKRKAQKNKTRYTTKHVGNQHLVVWNHNETVRQNYAKMGLVANPNADAKSLPKLLNEKEQLYDVPDSDILDPKNYKKKAHHMSEEEMKYLKPLMEAHGDEYDRMERDIKTNHLQWTRNKLKRRIARMKLYEANLI